LRFFALEKNSEILNLNTWETKNTIAPWKKKWKLLYETIELFYLRDIPFRALRETRRR